MNGHFIPDHRASIRRLAKARRIDRFLASSALALAALVAYAWSTGDFAITDVFSQRRIANFHRFVAELLPYPLQSRDWDWSTAALWMSDLMSARGWLAVGTTLAISVVAITLAGAGALILALPGTRTFATPEPYLPGARHSSSFVRAAWACCVTATRGLLILLRAVPEYVWAFLFVAVVGPSAWAAVLALAFHNLGILGKLNAEIVENLERESLGALRALGAGRAQIALTGILPAMFPRFLLFFFYRWETCVREASVLGMLGVVSLGYYIQDARARQHYDVMFALILLGACIVFVGDLTSAAARERVRRS